MKTLGLVSLLTVSCLLAACNTDPSMSTPQTVPAPQPAPAPQTVPAPQTTPAPQTVPAPETAPTPQTVPAMPIAGGYAMVDVNDQEVQAAAEFAAQALGGLLGKVTKAEQQVVAGMNYKLSIELQDGSKRNVVVYKDLEGNMSLTQQ